MINPRKVAVVGCGMVGSTIAYTLMQNEVFSEIVLIDANTAKAEGEVLDLNHGLPYAGTMKIVSGSYADAADATLIIIAAGAARKPGETRLELIGKNIRILSSIIGELKKTSFEGILLLVSNPVDVITHEAQRLSGYPAERVIGSGTVLDTARLKYELSKYLSVDARNVHTMIVGEHGDSEVPVWSVTNISGVDLRDFCVIRGHENYKEALHKIYQNVRDGGKQIIERKGATYYGIAMSVNRIAEALARNEHAVLPVSVLLTGEYGIDGVHLSLPTILGSRGVEQILPIPLSGAEALALVHSAEALKKTIAQAEELETDALRAEKK